MCQYSIPVPLCQKANAACALSLWQFWASWDVAQVSQWSVQGQCKCSSWCACNVYPYKRAYICTIFLHVLKGQCHEIFDFWFFSWISSPKPMSIPLVNNTSGTGGKICRQSRWYRWQICRRCRWNWWCTLTCEYLREFPKKFEMTLMLFSGAWGKAIHEKNLKQKISWHCPFNRGKWKNAASPTIFT